MTTHKQLIALVLVVAALRGVAWMLSLDTAGETSIPLMGNAVYEAAIALPSRTRAVISGVNAVNANAAPIADPDFPHIDRRTLAIMRRQETLVESAYLAIRARSSLKMHRQSSISCGRSARRGAGTSLIMMDSAPAGSPRARAPFRVPACK